MKLNLLFRSNDIRPDFENIDPFPLTPTNQAYSASKKMGDIKNLDWICQNGQAEEIILNHVLQFIPWQDYDRIMNHYLMKLKIGGFLTVIAPDVRQISKGFNYGHMDFTAFCHKIYGQNEAGTQHRGGVSLDIVRDVLQNQCCKILESRIFNYQFCLKAEKMPPEYVFVG